MSIRSKAKACAKFLGMLLCFPFKQHQATYNIIIAIVTALTLVWAAMTYHLLDQRERARNELYEIKERIKNSESTTVSLSTEYTVGLDGGYYIYPTITIKNVGKQKVKLFLENDALTIKKVRLKDDKIIADKSYNPNFYEKISSNPEIKNVRFRVMEIPVDGERKIPYAVRVSSKGVYYITFSARPYDEKPSDDSKDKELVWFAAEYKDVK
ncbi:hypothetical protein [Mixta calida]|uniref:hypothetical protein n=1 Tax=Mixta calida TaxID=665913 RepID=UPI0029135E7B|nr:hypothetical protein [Mixta calida]MDU6414991.1 hypothetical protein [Mixta calida]